MFRLLRHMYPGCFNSFRMFFFFVVLVSLIFFFFFFNDTATTEIYTLSLHDALPISSRCAGAARRMLRESSGSVVRVQGADRKSTRLNSSHSQISYAVFCLKKKKKRIRHLLRHPQADDIVKVSYFLL